MMIKILIFPVFPREKIKVNMAPRRLANVIRRSLAVPEQVMNKKNLRLVSGGRAPNSERFAITSGDDLY